MINPKLIDSIVTHINELPTMPASIMALLNLLKEDSSSAIKIEEVISTDQSLTMNVLKLCNSAYFGLKQEITSIRQAVSLLGFEAIKGLALSTFVQHLSDRQLDGYLIEKGGLWEHSLSVAAGSRLVAERFLKGFEDTAFTAGIVHDVGKIIMSKYLKNDFNEIISLIKKHNTPFFEAEKEVCSITHAEIGAMVSKKWKLPDIITDVIKNHHSPLDAVVNKKLVSIVHINDSVSEILGMTGGLDSANMNINEEVISILNISRNEYEDSIKKLVKLMLFSDKIIDE